MYPRFFNIVKDRNFSWCRIILVSLIFLLDSVNVFTQGYPFRQYSVLDGLPQSQATQVFQDSRGYIWIGTRNGLSKFDGTEFRNYYRKDGLPSNSGYQFSELSNDILLTVSSEGLSRYTGRGFKYYAPDQSAQGFLFNMNSTDKSDNEDNIYLIGHIPGKESTKIFIFKDGHYSDYSGKYYSLDTLNKICLSYDKPSKGLVILDKYGGVWLWKDNLLDRISENNFDLMEAENHRLIFSSSGEKFMFNNGEIDNHPWTTSGGLPYVKNDFSGLTNSVDYFDGKYVNRINLQFVPTSTFFDREGNLWMASETNIYRLLSTAFTYFTEDEISTKSIWAMAADKEGHIWFGSLYNDLVEYDGKSFHKRDEYKSFLRGRVSFYKGSRLLSNGELWLSTDRGVLIWDGKKLKRLEGLPDHVQVCYIYEDPDDKTVMLGTEKGLYILKDGKIDLMPEFKDNNLGVIEGVVKDDSDFYWLSGHHGIIKYHGGKILPGIEKFLPGCYSYVIEKDRYGGIWVTSEEGLFYKRKSSNSFINGLPEEFNKPANSISMMGDSCLLIGRVSDICIVNLDSYFRDEKNYFRVYDKTDGFTGSDCLDNGIVKDKSGRYWILTSDKVVVLDPSKLKVNKSPPRLYITAVDFQSDSLSWIPVDSSDYYYTISDHIRLNRFQNKIRISFTGISTTNPEKVTYRYLLEGYDSKWNQRSNKKFVVYESLPPGRYKFKLLATNADGVENKEPVVLKFNIVPAFWQTSIFKISAILLLLIVTAFITLFLTKRHQMRKAAEIKLRSELSRLQMGSVLRQFDPHFTFNAISSVGSLIMKEDKGTAYTYITKMSDLLRSVLRDGPLILKTLSDELVFVRKYCELQKLRYKERFSFDIIVDEAVDLQRELPKMTIQTLVENSIKHGFENRKEGGCIEISIRDIDTNTEITVRDNGIGRKAAKTTRTEGTGHGLKILRSLFDIMNRGNKNPVIIRLKDIGDNGQPAGTEVKILIPNHYNFTFMITDKFN